MKSWVSLSTEKLRKATVGASHRDMEDMLHDLWVDFGCEGDISFASVMRAIADRIDKEIEYEYVMLPKDQDGVPIRIGDVMEWPTTNETFEVVGIGDGTLFYVEDGNEKADWTGASTKRHYHVPTFEDVMVEFAADWESALDGEEKTAVLKEYAKRLKLAEEGE